MVKIEKKTNYAKPYVKHTPCFWKTVVARVTPQNRAEYTIPYTMGWYMQQHIRHKGWPSNSQIIFNGEKPRKNEMASTPVIYINHIKARKTVLSISQIVL